MAKENTSGDDQIEIVEEDGTVITQPEGDDKSARPAAKKADDDGEEGLAVGGAVDERLGETPGSEGGETREELSARQRRRQRERQARNVERAELARLRAENAALNQRVQHTAARVANVEVNALDTQMAAIEQEIARANAVMGRAMAAQNAQDFTDAQDIRDTLRDRLRDLKGFKARQDEETRRAAEGGRAETGGDVRLDGQPGTGFRPTREQAVNARIFLQRHPWYKLQGGDEDSRTVTEIDNEMMAEGGNPSTAEYWQELERRIVEELPHRKVAETGGEEGQGETRERKQQGNGAGGRPRIAGPKLPGGGGSGGGGGGPVKFHLSAARKQALVDLGVWDDPDKRMKHIKNFIRWDKDHQTN